MFCFIRKSKMRILVWGLKNHNLKLIVLSCTLFVYVVYESVLWYNWANTIEFMLQASLSRFLNPIVSYSRYFIHKFKSLNICSLFFCLKYSTATRNLQCWFFVALGLYMKSAMLCRKSKVAMRSLRHAATFIFAVYITFIFHAAVWKLQLASGATKFTLLKLSFFV